MCFSFLLINRITYTSTSKSRCSSAYLRGWFDKLFDRETARPVRLNHRLDVTTEMVRVLICLPLRRPFVYLLPMCLLCSRSVQYCVSVSWIDPLLVTNTQVVTELTKGYVSRVSRRIDYTWSVVDSCSWSVSVVFPSCQRRSSIHLMYPTNSLSTLSLRRPDSRVQSYPSRVQSLVGN